MSYRVEVHENYQAVILRIRDLGEFANLDSAVSAAKSVIDSYLIQEYIAGTDQQTLLKSFTNWGETPYIWDSTKKPVKFDVIAHLNLAISNLFNEETVE